MEIIGYIILWNIKDNSCIPFQMSTQSEVLYFFIFFFYDLLVNKCNFGGKCYFFLCIYLNVFKEE